MDEYLVKSSLALQALEESLARLFEDSNRTTPVKTEEEEERGLLIVFLSAKGGTGISSLARTWQ